MFFRKLPRSRKASCVDHYSQAIWKANPIGGKPYERKSLLEQNFSHFLTLTSFLICIVNFSPRQNKDDWLQIYPNSFSIFWPDKVTYRMLCLEWGNVHFKVNVTVSKCPSFVQLIKIYGNALKQKSLVPLTIMYMFKIEHTYCLRRIPSLSSFVATVLSQQAQTVHCYGYQ